MEFLRGIMICKLIKLAVVVARAMARLFSCLFSALLLFSWVGCCAAAKTESVLVDEYSMQLTVRALLGEEMRTQDKKISDLDK